MSQKLIDVTGQTFARLTVITYLRTGASGSEWECLCSCGTITVSTGASLRSGKKRSCGCLATENKRRMGLRNPAGKIGPLNNRWKGGKRLDEDGYIQTSLKYHYPDLMIFYPKKYRIPEHVAVIVRHLGRALYPGETVHHKNGVRHDNTFENLEIWNKPQPTGCRTEDQIEWATELLKRYAPERLSNRPSIS